MMFETQPAAVARARAVVTMTAVDKSNVGRRENENR
jgi:hypothetical protein